jgi:endoglucanase
MKRFGFTWILGLAACLACRKAAPVQPEISSGPTLPALHVEGRWIVNGLGEKKILRGVNIASLEWTSAGDNMARSLGVAVDVWKANLVRIPLSQDRWFGKASEQTDGGAAYRGIVSDLVRTADLKSCYVLLELHWNNAGFWGSNIGQHKMPDSLSIEFWKALAGAFGGHPAVLFGLYNEPHDVSWNVWLNGGPVSETVDQNGVTRTLAYRAVGFQALADTVRAAGAAGNLLVIGGLDWAYDLRGVASGYAVRGTGIVYDTHAYPWKDPDWDGRFGDVGRGTAILVGEWGGNISEGYREYVNDMAAYLRENKFSWTAWDFHPSAGPTLIADWDYTPTGFGGVVKSELANPVEAE